ncbi:hydrolase [Paenibacillus yonginensis]|uniref:Hydrolase n=1 Tax=Paenibacillus yonginensis TaxID=1462996 RepID=A0A1B1MYP1_9BACL|nr:FeoB-associated Cys-rich membrane protein [Paenibacillus yonginensis]ANS74295.1 hydrolase [Paenibacillus yonginensis]
MAASLVLGLLIFGYAAWTLVSFIRKSRKGKCAACSMNKNCGASASCGKTK